MRMKVSEHEAKKRIIRLVTETVGTEQLRGHAAIRIYLHRYCCPKAWEYFFFFREQFVLGWVGFCASPPCMSYSCISGRDVGTADETAAEV